MNAKYATVQERIQADRRSAEDWFCGHLHAQYQIDVRRGITTPQERVANIVKLVREKGIADKQLGRFNDRPESYRQFCRRALGIDVDTP